MKRKTEQQGQVLLLAVAVLLVLTVAAMLLFDFHNVIRAKLKVESAQQAAALAGAQWQVIGLNMLGDVNLLKATTLMTQENEDIPSLPLSQGRSGFNSNDEYEKAQKLQRLRSRLRTLSETQSRISFIVPLLGFMAVQQTAKQNGMSGNSNMLRIYHDETLPLNGWRERPVEGFLWFDPYRKLVKEIMEQRCAVRCNARIQEMPDQWSDPAGTRCYRTGDQANFKLLLSDRSLYAAISTLNFCHWQLKKMVKNAWYLTEPWWYIDYLPGDFIQESEILPLGIQYLTGTDMTELASFLTDQNMPGPIAKDEEYPEKNWCCYDRKWYPNTKNWSEISAYNADAYAAQQYGWRRGIWLRNDRRQGFLYEGAVCAVDCAVDLSRSMNFRPGSQTDPVRIQGDDLVRHRKTATITVGGTSEANSGNQGVVVKVLGGFHDLRDENDAPISVPVILPVFSRGLLVPCSLPADVQMMTGGEDSLKKFLIWLSSKPNIFTDPPPSGTEVYLFLLKKLMDPDFLRQGYNPDFSGLDSVAPERLFAGDYKFDKDTNPSGAGWLQQAYIARAAAAPAKRVDSGKKDKNGDPVMIAEPAVPDNEVTTLPQTYTAPDGTTQKLYEDFSDAVRVYYGTKAGGYHYYIVRSGVIQTNEDVGCDGKLYHSSSTGSFVDGSESGPGSRGGGSGGGGGGNIPTLNGRY